MEMSVREEALDEGGQFEPKFEWQQEIVAKYERLDLDRLWSLCGATDERTNAFGSELLRTLLRYTPRQRALPKLPAKQRERFFAKFEKSARSLKALLEDLPPALEIEFLGTMDYHTPEGFFDETDGTEYEGLGYFDFHAYRIIDSLSVLLEHLPEVHAEHLRSAGRPKQNENLEETIRRLGKLFFAVSGQSVATRFRYVELDTAMPYQGPFMEFLCATLWSFNEKEFPSNATLGEAARRAFSLRK